MSPRKKKGGGWKYWRVGLNADKYLCLKCGDNKLNMSCMASPCWELLNMAAIVDIYNRGEWS